MRCNLITDRENTVGLATDAELLSAFLHARGHTVTIAHWRDMSPPADVNFYLEKLAPQHFDTTPKHVGIFNLEWFSPSWVPHLQHMTQIWAKSAAAHEWYMERGFDRVRYTSFLSRDPFDPSAARERRALHLAGRSSAKNTTAVLRAYWDADAAGIKLPWLDLVSFAAVVPTPPRVTQHSSIVRGALDFLLNNCRFHLCPSEIEGWGHYIVEATACRGIVITTDASPMFEHVLPTFGRLLTYRVTLRRDGLGHVYVGSRQIIDALLELEALPDSALDTMGDQARAWNRRRNEAFEHCAGKLLQELEAA